jgi:hypothetical protein
MELEPVNQKNWKIVARSKNQKLFPLGLTDKGG